LSQEENRHNVPLSVFSVPRGEKPLPLRSFELLAKGRELLLHLRNFFP
jgi:hypothetical protein